MKKLSIALVVVFMFSLLSGCGKFEANESTVYLRKKGNITGIITESFDKDYYDATELQNELNDLAAEHTLVYGEESVVIESFAVENQIAKLTAQYASAQDYAIFNDVTLFSGTLVDAVNQGYQFPATMISVAEGQMSGETTVADILSNADYKAVVLSEKINVKVDGDIAYVSADYTSIAAEDTVAIALPDDAPDGAESALVYIIYK